MINKNLVEANSPSFTTFFAWTGVDCFAQSKFSFYCLITVANKIVYKYFNLMISPPTQLNGFQLFSSSNNMQF